jgi:hypothetical protein
VLVAFVYYVIYRWPPSRASASPSNASNADQMPTVR